MLTNHIGDIRIDRIIEQEFPMFDPTEFLPELTKEMVDPHRHWLEPKFFDPISGLMTFCMQSYVIRTGTQNILIDTCIGNHKNHPARPSWHLKTDNTYIDALTKAGLWEEVKDRLTDAGTALSGGQQQRLCIARAIAVSPEVILMDEPCSALDPIATAKIEELIDELKENYAIVIVTHSMQQAARVSQRTAFFHLGNLVEYGETSDIFTNPREEKTKDYITGRYG